MQVERIQKITKKSKQRKQDFKDRKQYNRMFTRSFQGGLPKKLIKEHEELHSAKRMV